MQRTRVYLATGLFLLSAIGVCPAAPRNATSVLAIPVRRTIVELAFNVARMRSLVLVSYDKVPDTDEVVMHTWNASARHWESLTLEAYSTGDWLVGEDTEQVIVIGRDEGATAAVTEASSWAKTVVSIPTLNLMEVINQLDGCLEFSPREWKRLARKHGLKLEDANAERRRYGRYGPPEAKHAPVVDVSTELEPEPLTEPQAEDPVKSEPAMEPRPAEVTPTVAPAAKPESSDVEKAAAAEDAFEKGDPQETIPLAKPHLSPIEAEEGMDPADK